MPQAQRLALYGLFALVLALQVFVWIQVRDDRARWLNVPPVPSSFGATAFALGDTQFAYRIIGITLQNFGDSGGRVTAFHEYDYERLAAWLRLASRLDPISNYAPGLAAYYFSAVDDPKRIDFLAEYLHDVGLSTEGEKWRFLAQAIYLKRFKVGDMDTAYEWSLELAMMDKPNMPAWTKQMPAFIKNAEGDKQAAYDILVEIIKSGKNKMSKEEINAMTGYICERILVESEAKKDPLCQGQ